MSETSAAAAGGETRQAMIRVWMAISAIWIAFWLCMATLVLMTGEMTSPFAEGFRLFALIVMIPPLALLAIGVFSRLAFEALFRRGARA
jgi:hypothetical protein